MMHLNHSFFFFYKYFQLYYEFLRCYTYEQRRHKGQRREKGPGAGDKGEALPSNNFFPIYYCKF